MPLPWCAPPFRPLPPNAAANIEVQTGIPHGATRMPHWQRRCPRASPPDQLDPKDRSRDHFFRLYVSHLRVAYLPCRLDFVGKLLVQLQYRQCLVYKVFILLYIVYICIYIPVYLYVPSVGPLEILQRPSPVRDWWHQGRTGPAQPLTMRCTNSWTAQNIQQISGRFKTASRCFKDIG